MVQLIPSESIYEVLTFPENRYRKGPEFKFAVELF